MYFAHPMDQAQGVPFNHVREALHQALGTQCYYDPSNSRVQTGQEAEIERVAEQHRVALRLCWGLVAYLPAGVPTLGTPVEIQDVLDQEKPVVLVCDEITAQTFQVAMWRKQGAEVVVTHRQAEWTAALVGVLRGLAEKYTPAPLHEYTPAPLHEYTPAPLHEIRYRVHPGLGELAVGQRGYAGDAGFDLSASEATLLPEGEFVDVPCGYDLALPDTMWAMIVSRSSVARRGLLVSTAIIDSGYRGPIFVGVQNLAGLDIVVGKEERLAQIIPMPLLSDGCEWIESRELPPSERGARGFGSSGR